MLTKHEDPNGSLLYLITAKAHFCEPQAHKSIMSKKSNAKIHFTTYVHLSEISLKQKEGHCKDYIRLEELCDYYKLYNVLSYSGKKNLSQLFIYFIYARVHNCTSRLINGLTSCIQLMVTMTRRRKKMYLRCSLMVMVMMMEKAQVV